MSDNVLFSDEEKKAFASVISTEEGVLNNISKQEVKFDAFNALIGSERILTEIKSKLPLSIVGQVLVNCDPSNSQEVLIALTKFVLESKKVPVLVLMNYNYKTISTVLKESKITEGFVIIDTVSKSIASVEDKENLIFIDSLRNLTQLQIRMLNVVEKNPNCTFIFDSLAMLRLYHNEEVAFKFIYSLTKLLHKNNSSGFYISGKKSFASKLAQFFDESIDLKKFLQ
ncbi:MAG: hypothetical protein WCW13_02985 [archaeon]|jgi:hypothetical protein